MESRNKSDQYLLRLPNGMRERLKEAANANLRTMNSEIVLALTKWLEQQARSATRAETGRQA